MNKIFSLLVIIFLIFGFSTSTAIQQQPQQNGQYKSVNKVGKLPKEFTDSIIDNDLIDRAVKTDDGFLLPIINAESKDATEKDDNYFDIKKYDLKGNFLWEKHYPTPERISLSNKSITLTADRGYILAITPATYQKPDRTWVYSDPAIVKCDKNGEVIWSRAYKGFSATTLQKIFETENGDIITIGDTETNRTIGVVSPGDIYLSKLDKDGNLLCEEYYGGADFDSLYNAEYMEGVGVVSSISTQSKDGIFSASRDGYPVGVIAMFDLSLKLVWNKSICDHPFSELAIYDGGIYTFGDRNIRGVNPAWEYSLIKLDINGDMVFTKGVGQGYNVHFVEGSSKGLMMTFRNKLMLFDTNGNIKLEIPFDAGTVDKVIQYDKYFLVLSINTTGDMPQSGSFSVVTHNTELVYSGYNYKGKLIWRDAF